MTFSMYQSLRTVPDDLDEAALSFHLSGWQRFWRLEVPFAMPGLVWNTMMSMSGGWFFVVASEAITVGNNTWTAARHRLLRRAGASSSRTSPAVGWAILAMLVVILLYDQLLFRPLVAWSEKFRFETTAGATAADPWMLDLLRRTRLLQRRWRGRRRRCIGMSAACGCRSPRRRRGARPRPPSRAGRRASGSLVLAGRWRLAGWRVVDVRRRRR